MTSTQISQHEQATDEKEEDIDVGANISLLDSMEHKKKHMYSNIVTRIWHTDWCPWIPARYVLAVMSFLGFVNVYALRVNLSMALVVMVNNTEDAHLNNVRIVGYPYAYVLQLHAVYEPCIRWCFVLTCISLLQIV